MRAASSPETVQQAARAAVAGWSSQSAYLRGQILYRAAELLETRESELRAELRRGGASGPAARTEVSRAIDRLVHYAGWTDKFGAILSGVNPVASSMPSRRTEANPVSEKLIE